MSFLNDSDLLYMQKNKMSTAEENSGGDSKRNDVLLLKKRWTFHHMELDNAQGVQSAYNPLASSQHSKVTLQISTTTSYVTTKSILYPFYNFTFFLLKDRMRIGISILRERNHDSHFSKNHALLKAW